MILSILILLAVITVGVAVVRAHRNHVTIATVLHSEVESMGNDLDKLSPRIAAAVRSELTAVRADIEKLSAKVDAAARAKTK